MPTALHGDVALEYDERGPDVGETILLIMGIGAQLTAWREGFCDLLVDQGFRVIRFDNRDAGLSSTTPGTPPSYRELLPIIVPARGAGTAPRRPVPYTFSDMAADAIAVLDAAGVERAHVVGASLGGMIAQTVAIEHPDRVRSLTSIMSKPGALTVGLPTVRVFLNSLKDPPGSRSANIDFEVARSERIAGPLFDRDAMRGFISDSMDRASQPNGMMFQAAAMFASGDRTRALRSLRTPTLVIHGRVDPLVKLSGGEATARAVPGAQLLVLNDMGHDLPRPLWPTLTDAIGAHAVRATVSAHGEAASQP